MVLSLCAYDYNEKLKRDEKLKKELNITDQDLINARLEYTDDDLSFPRTDVEHFLYGRDYYTNTDDDWYDPKSRRFRNYFIKWAERQKECENVESSKEEFDKHTYNNTFREQKHRFSKLLDKIDELTDDNDFDDHWFDVGYSSLSQIRQYLATKVNAKYYYAEYYTHDEDWALAGKPKPDSYSFEHPFPQDSALYRFFMHYDCDGETTATDVKILDTVFSACDYSDLPKFEDKDFAKVMFDFLDFLSESARNNRCWVWC